jgi:hypothetical protein
MNDQPFGEDYSRPAPRPASDMPKLIYDDEDPYDDGLNPARGMINGCIMGIGLIIALYVIYLGADYALTKFIAGS